MPRTPRTFAVRLIVHITVVVVAVAVLSPSIVAPSADARSFPVQIADSGSVTTADRGRVIEQTFSVPPGTGQIDIDFSHTQPVTEAPVQFDLGLRSPEGLRGWSEDHRGHIHIDATSASYGYLPGPIGSGQWSLLIGVASVSAGSTDYRVSIRLSGEIDGPRPTLRTGQGWYAGDLHVHSGHSDGRTRNGRVPVTVEDLAKEASRRGLDFVAVTDHNTSSHWLEIDRIQAGTDRVLLLHGREITTYHGHFNAIGELRASSIDLNLRRSLRDLIDDAASDGSFVSINHPWVADDAWCPGCSWTHMDDATVTAAHAIEIANGPTRGSLPGWTLWVQLLNRGHRLVAVGGSDIHDLNGGDRRLGEPTTVVYASALSESAIVNGLKSGRVYGRTRGPDGPEVDVRAEDDLGARAMMGQSIPAGHIRITAVINRATGQQCVWIKRGREVGVGSIDSNRASLTFEMDAHAGDWLSVLIRAGARVTAWSNAIYIADPHLEGEIDVSTK